MMKDTVAGRLGVVVEFRLEGTAELLWEGPFHSIPRVDETLTYALDDEAPTTYKVESVRYDCRVRTITVLDGQGNPVESVTELCSHTPVVTVSLV